jgi:curved DNA-binding protein CbpA
MARALKRPRPTTPAPVVRRKISQIRQRAVPASSTPTPPAEQPTELVCGGYLTAVDFQRRLESMDDQNLFEILGVDDSAGIERIEKSYQTQLFIWHPDRLAPHQIELRPLATCVCARLGGAYQELRDPLRRAEHRREVAQELGSVRQRRNMALLAEAADLAESAQMLIRHRRFEEARRKLEKAIALDGQPAMYRVLLTWVEAEAMGPPPKLRPGETSDVYHAQLDALDREIGADPHFERARYFRAQLLKRSGYLEQAHSDFRIAAKLNRRNIGAAREVRIYEMRVRRASRSWLQRVFTKEPPGDRGR